MSWERVEQAAAWLRPRLGTSPRAALVLGSGLAGLERLASAPSIVDYAAIPNFPHTRIEGHAGRLASGVAGGAGLLVFSGRTHYYEGADPEALTFGVRLAARLGVRTLVLTNAAGGINPDHSAGDLMIVSDHINLMGFNPLRGPGDERWGPRFVDLSEVYDARLRSRLQAAGRGAGLSLGEGVYAAVSGPSYETPAEIEMLRRLGADAVGMSTVPEAIVARQAGLRVAAVSLIANAAAHRGGTIDHSEVIAGAAAGEASLGSVLERFFALPEEGGDER